jgi:hypothetical protein
LPSRGFHFADNDEEMWRRKSRTAGGGCKLGEEKKKSIWSSLDKEKELVLSFVMDGYPAITSTCTYLADCSLLLTRRLEEMKL